MTKLSGARKVAAQYLTLPVVRLMSRTSITPNAVSWFGFVLSLGAAALIVSEHLFAAGWMVLIAGFFDMLDGALARSTNRITRFGAVLDSTLDRLAEAAILFGILAMYAVEQSLGGILVVALALLGSLMVSYVRARAEGAGLECQVGVGTRAERVIVVALGLLLNAINYALMFALVIIIVVTYITVVQRLLSVWRQAKNN